MKTILKCGASANLTIPTMRVVESGCWERYDMPVSLLGGSRGSGQLRTRISGFGGGYQRDGRQSALWTNKGKSHSKTLA